MWQANKPEDLLVGSYASCLAVVWLLHCLYFFYRLRIREFCIKYLVALSEIIRVELRYPWHLQGVGSWKCGFRILSHTLGTQVHVVALSCCRK